MKPGKDRETEIRHAGGVSGNWFRQGAQKLNPRSENVRERKQQGLSPEAKEVCHVQGPAVKPMKMKPVSSEREVRGNQGPVGQGKRFGFLYMMWEISVETLSERTWSALGSWVENRTGRNKSAAGPPYGSPSVRCWGWGPWGPREIQQDEARRLDWRYTGRYSAYEELSFRTC